MACTGLPDSIEVHTLDVTSRDLYIQSPGAGMITSSEPSETRLLRAAEVNSLGVSGVLNQAG